MHKAILDHCATLVAEMKDIFLTKQMENCYCTQWLWTLDTVGAVRKRLEELTAQDQLKHMGHEVSTKYKNVFEPIPHVDELPTDV